MTSGLDHVDDGPVHRGQLIAAGFTFLARWSLRLVLVAAGAVLVGYVVGQLWVVILPVALALLLTTVLDPVSEWLHRRAHLPRSLSAALTLVVAIAVLAGLVVLVVESVVNQIQDVANQASFGLSTVRDFLTGPPLNLAESQIDNAVTTVTAELQSRAGTIATGVFTGVSTVSSLAVTAVLALVLAFYFLKDGQRFLPFVEGVTGRRAGVHLSAVLGRAWHVLSGYVRVQVLVAAVDATLIGLGLVLLGVPLALSLGVITFLFSFIPIAGAVIAGVLAVLVALVTNGFGTAVLVLVVVLAVQQIEGNVLQPVLQSRSLNLHPGLVLLAVTGGSALFGIVGAFLAVPVVGVLWEVGRYLGERIDERTGDETVHDDDRPSHPDDEPDEPDATRDADHGSSASGARPAPA